MKNKLLLLITFLSITLTMKAQILVDTGKIWTVTECVGGCCCSTPAYFFQGDTTIGNYVYKKLILNSTAGFPVFPIPIAAREDSSKKVYFYSNSAESLYYDFSLNVGDTFAFGNPPSCNFQLYVDSVDTIILLNGEPRRRLYLSNFWAETWIEGIGSLYGLLNVGVYFCSADVYPELNCFKETDTLKYQNLNYNSCYINTFIGSINRINNNWSVYPNPFNDYSILDLNNSILKNGTLKLFNLQGSLKRIVYNLNGDHIKIEKLNLETGAYFFELFTDQRLVANGKLLIY